MVFGMITSGKALLSRAGKSIMPSFFFVFIKLTPIQPPWLLVYSQILYSCTTIILMCVFVCKCSGSEILKGFFNAISAHA